MKFNKIVAYILFLMTTQIVLAQTQPVSSSATIESDSNVVCIKNSFMSIKIDLKENSYSIQNEKTKTIYLKDAVFGFDGWNNKNSTLSMLDKKIKILWKQKDLYENSVKGKRLELYFTITSRDLPEYRLAFNLLDNSKYVVMQTGIKNTQLYACRFSKSDLFGEAIVFPGAEVNEAKTLNGAAGITMPEVLADVSCKSNNNMLLTAVVNGKRASIVWGGLKYAYYYATTSYSVNNKTNTRTISLSMNDPVGRLIEPNEEWWVNDTYYLGISEDDPFLALEDYGYAMRYANNAHPNSYSFPTLCGWAVGSLSHGKNINNSLELIKQLDEAKKCGITKFTKVAVRLEPDTYCYNNGNTEQGWWDDEHWSKFRHLVEPYETFSKWCAKVNEMDGIPFTYFQANLPSDDFAKTHPEWMLKGDISFLNQFHRHHQPLVRFDYTDSLFRKHVTGIWKRLRKDGMVGIKFDYPETAWCPNGGFDDPKATTTSAYREMFKLCREGLGPNARIHERALGESGVPTLDVCAGLIDIQRNASDNNRFETQYVTSSGLRWYKSGVVFACYPDSKAIHIYDSDIRKSLLTMMAFTTGRLELATPFEMLTPEMVYDISRIYPYYSEKRRAKPIDAFTGVSNPQIYDLALTPDWHQVAFFNGESPKASISLSLNKSTVAGGLNLPAGTEYYVYDFWGDRFVGKLSSAETISVALDSMHCALYSVRKVEKTPQVISTNRHILQGWLDTKDVKWTPQNKTLSGIASVIMNEPFKIVIASNTWKEKKVEVDGAIVEMKDYPHHANLKVITIQSTKSKDVKWTVFYK